MLRLQNRMFNWPARWLLAKGLAPPTYTCCLRTTRMSAIEISDVDDRDTGWMGSSCVGWPRSAQARC